ncbi:MAG: RNA pseudouridine synthase [Bacteroidota bacterium]
MNRKIKFKDWIAFENDDYIVINKPAFMSTLADRKGEICVLDLSKDYCSDSSVCHRLDKETSGALLIAKSKDAYKHASKQFTERTVEKTYHAVAEGVHQFENEIIDKPLLIAPSGSVRISASKGKKSSTVVSSLEYYKFHTLVSCKPITGRMHQIRIHMASVGAPLMADLTYGGKHLYLSELKKKYKFKTEKEERPLMSRVALHAFSLKFIDLQGNEQYIECPYPKDFRVVLNQLAKNI